MDAAEAKKYLEQAGNSGIIPGLSRIKKLLHYLGDPQDKLQFIHVAGTNGKGSVCAYISSVLAVSGYCVGRFVSPAVFCQEEIIQRQDADGIHYIAQQLFAELVTEAAQAADRMYQEQKEMAEDSPDLPTRFEIETAVAFLAFVHWNCDIVVLETGLGGKEDATNIIENVLLTVITPIAMDHRSILGDTIEEVAEQKAGIIRKGVTVITMQENRDAKDVIFNTARDQKAELVCVREQDCHVISMDLDGTHFVYDSAGNYLKQKKQGKMADYTTRMAGAYQVRNACLAIEACRHLPIPFLVTGENIKQGIRQAQWRGRFERISGNPGIILDGAHNEAGAEALLETLDLLGINKNLHVIMGVYKDKDYKRIVEIIAPAVRDVITITPPGPRGLDKEILAKIWRDKGCRDVSAAEHINEAIERAVGKCKGEEIILVFGSLSFMCEIESKRESWDQG